MILVITIVGGTNNFISVNINMVGTIIMIENVVNIVIYILVQNIMKNHCVFGMMNHVLLSKLMIKTYARTFIFLAHSILLKYAHKSLY